MELAGTWSSAELSAELVVAGDQVSGAFVLAGARFPLAGRRDGDRVVGGFEAQGAQFGFVAYRDGDELVIESEGVAYRLRRAAPAPVNPLKAARAAAPPAAPAVAPAVDDGGTLYRHPTGGEMRLPRGWQVTQSQLGLQLVPPDPAMTMQGPAELYIVAAQPAPGIARADDPRLTAYVDATLRQLIPLLGPASAPAPCGPGVQLRWSARNPMTGDEILAVALLQVGNDAVASILGLGERSRIEGRLPALEAIFASFRRGERRLDPALVGLWHHWSYRSTGGGYGSGASTSSETRRTVQLGADGSVAERSSHEGIGNFQGKDGHGDVAWNAGYASQSGDGRSGTWSAGDGMLFVQWSDGSGAAWHYQLQGAQGNRRLVLVAPGDSKPTEWTERPVSF